MHFMAWSWASLKMIKRKCTKRTNNNLVDVNESAQSTACDMFPQASDNNAKFSFLWSAMNAGKGFLCILFAAGKVLEFFF